MPWVDVSFLVDVHGSLSFSDAYCEAVERRFAVPAETDTLAPLTRALEEVGRREVQEDFPVKNHLSVLEAFHGQDRDAWESLCRAPPHLLVEHSISLIQYIHEPKVPIAAMMRIMTLVLHDSPPNKVWDSNLTKTLPIPILTSVLAHPDFDSARDETLYCFFALYLESVHEFNFQAYDHALKQLMNFFLEYRQQLHETKETRKRFTALGALLLERRIQKALHLCLEPSANASDRIRGDTSLCTVLDLYAPKLLAGGITHRRILRPIGLALVHDSIKAANACLALPETAKSIHAARKKIMSTPSSDTNASTDSQDEALYSDLWKEHAQSIYGPTIASNLWHECALAISSDESETTMLGLYFVRATSAVSLFFPAPVAETLLPRRISAESESDFFEKLSKQMLSAVVQTRHAMATISEQFGVASTSGARSAWDALLDRCMDSLVFLYASDAPTIRSGATPTTDVDFGINFSRFEILHAQFSEDADTAANSLDRFLRAYLYVMEHVPSAVFSAATFLSTLDDVLHVLCDHNMGLYLPFVPWHPHPDAVQQQDSRLEPACVVLWHQISMALAKIFAQVPHWSRTAGREDLLAWLPRVPALASFMVKRVSVTVAAVTAMNDPQCDADEVLLALAIPLDSAIGWLRLNHKELLQELADYIRRVVQTFSKAYVPLPPHVTQHAVDFLTQQLDIAHTHERKTLLSTAQMELLLDELLALPKEARPQLQPSVETKQQLAFPESQGKAKQAGLSGSLRQQTLSFSSKNGEVVDLTSDSPRNGFRPSSIVSSSKGFNRLGMNRPSSSSKSKTGFGQGHANQTSTNSTSSGPPSKLSQLRSEFQATRSTARRPHAPTRTMDTDEPRAPLAVSSVTGVTVPASVPRREPVSQTTDENTSSSDEDSDQEVKGISALRNPTKQPTAKPTIPPRRSVMLLEDSALQKTMRKAQDDGRLRRLRMQPDFTELHRCILAWNMSTNTVTPPAPPKDLSGVLSNETHPVPPTFRDSRHYMQVYGSLFLRECWAQFQQSRDEIQESDMIDVGVSIGGSVNEMVRLDCKMPTPPKWTLSDADIVCLQVNKEMRLLAKVQNVENRARSYTVSLLCHPNSADQRAVVQRASSSQDPWKIGKLFSLVTLRREYAALLSVPDLGLVEDILRARSAKRADIKDADVIAAGKKFGVNLPQARAILGTMRTPGFSMIQGPPGTGKTKTISALIATFLQRRRASGSGTKMLVCAPSNAAIDEIVARVQHGVLVDGKLVEPRLIRIGREDAVNSSVRDATLEAAVERRRGQRADSTRKQQAARTRLADLEKAWQEKEQELKRTEATAVARQLQAELNLLADQRLEAREELDSLSRTEKSQGTMDDARRHHHRVEILNETEIVCATLAGAGHDLLYPLDFDTVIIDEAVQAVELSTLIPLRYNCTRCIMVGDPKQLPPTVISQEAEQLGYSQSLFVRMFSQTPENVYLLSIQYRMHPHISLFPSTTFYDGQLQDGDAMAIRTAQPWHTVSLFAPFRMLNVSDGRESQGRGHSLVNRAEAEAAIALYDSLQKHSQERLEKRVGFITMYKAQVLLMRNLFRARYGAEALQDATFNTVDGFQGQEKDVIILTCVRSNARNAIGFLGDERRLNVALTRAKSNMFVLGNTAMLKQSGPVWEKLVSEADTRGYIIDVSSSTFRTPTRAKPSTAVDSTARSRPIERSRAASKHIENSPTSQTNRKDTDRLHDRSSSSSGKTQPVRHSDPIKMAKPSDEARAAEKQHTSISASHGPKKTAARAPPMDLLAKPVRSTNHALQPSHRKTQPPTVPSKRGHSSESSSSKSIPRADSNSIPRSSDQPPDKKGKWASIVAQSNQKPSTPRPTRITPGESRDSPASRKDGPSWLRSARPGGIRR